MSRLFSVYIRCLRSVDPTKHLISSPPRPIQAVAANGSFWGEEGIAHKLDIPADYGLQSLCLVPIHVVGYRPGIQQASTIDARRQ